MVENDEAVIKAGMAIGQFQIVDGPAREFRFGEMFQVVAPVAEAATERKRQVNFISNSKRAMSASSKCQGLPNWI